jgi:hypothetical protein
METLHKSDFVKQNAANLILTTGKTDNSSAKSKPILVESGTESTDMGIKSAV